jgi:branched-chain amino acid transport system substrate-binding protein
MASLAAVLVLLVGADDAQAQKRYDTGASDTEIKIGNITPYSGPASAYGIFGKVQDAYFKMLNAEGGINGRKVTYLSYDDGYNPSKTVEQARKLVEGDGVLLTLSTVGTTTNAAILKYMNSKKVPQLFVVGGATMFSDPKTSPWTMGWAPNYDTEGRVYARYILQNYPAAKIGVIYPNDDFGKDLLKGLRDGLAGKGSMIVAQQSYETSEPTIDAHIVKLKDSGADLLVDLGTPKFVAQAIKEVAELGWKPLHIINSPASAVGSTLKPAGLDISQGLITVGYVKDPTDEAWKDDPAVKQYEQFMSRFYPDGDKLSIFGVMAYSQAQTLVEVLKKSGDNLTRENVMRNATSLNAFNPGLLLPGITIDTSSTDYAPIKNMRMMRFSGESWKLFGPVVNAK